MRIQYFLSKLLIERYNAQLIMPLFCIWYSNGKPWFLIYAVLKSGLIWYHCRMYKSSDDLYLYLTILSIEFRLSRQTIRHLWKCIGLPMRKFWYIFANMNVVCHSRYVMVVIFLNELWSPSFFVCSMYNLVTNLNLTIHETMRH